MVTSKPQPHRVALLKAPGFLILVCFDQISCIPANVDQHMMKLIQELYQEMLTEEFIKERYTVLKRQSKDLEEADCHPVSLSWKFSR